MGFLHGRWHEYGFVLLDDAGYRAGAQPGLPQRFALTVAAGERSGRVRGGATARSEIGVEGAHLAKGDCPKPSRTLHRPPRPNSASVSLVASRAADAKYMLLSARWPRSPVRTRSSWGSRATPLGLGISRHW
jgi:hypothetical protein